LTPKRYKPISTDPTQVAIDILIYPNTFFVNKSPYPIVVMVTKIYQSDSLNEMIVKMSCSWISKAKIIIESIKPIKHVNSGCSMYRFFII
jgi:hypothetical protein